MIPFSNADVRIPKGCNICRVSKVKCQEQRPSCPRCIRLGRVCSWPAPEPRLRIRRRGPGTFRSRMGSQALATLLPSDALNVPGSQVHGSEDAPPASTSTNPASLMDTFLGYDEVWEDMSLENVDIEDLMGMQYTGSFESVQLPSFMNSENFTGTLGTITDDNGYLDLQPMVYRSLPDQHIPLPSSLVLGSEEHNALGHYQSTFSIYRTTKKPKWSTHTLLLDLGNENPMIMHFILAVSINDICHRREHESSQEAQSHFEVGASELITTMKRDSAKDHISLMVAFLLLYLYIPKRKSVPRERIEQLSKTVYEYIKRHRLDSRCLERTSGAVVDGENFSDADRTLLARLIIWIYDEDVKCSFQGFGGYLADHLTTHRERTMAVYEMSRTALEAHWGSKYPREEAADDDDNAMELEFLWALTALWQDINQLNQGPEDMDDSIQRIEQRFRLLERKYSPVFQSSAQTTMPRSRNLINADYDVILFHALKIYLFRSRISDLDEESPAYINEALENLLHIIRRTFASNRNELHDRLQWPMFLVGIEIEDGFARDWIIDRLSKRPRTALKKVIEVQEASSPRTRMKMGNIRDLLYGERRSETPGTLTDRGFLLDDLVLS